MGGNGRLRNPVFTVSFSCSMMNGFIQVHPVPDSGRLFRQTGSVTHCSKRSHRSRAPIHRDWLFRFFGDCTTDGWMTLLSGAADSHAVLAFAGGRMKGRFGILPGNGCRQVRICLSPCFFLSQCDARRRDRVGFRAFRARFCVYRTRAETDSWGIRGLRVRLWLCVPAT